jgi:non-specific serine/threonine protein kinase
LRTRIDGAARLVETVVHLCPRTTVLATSREALRIEGEYVYRVSRLDAPLPHQEEPGKILRHSAVQLFIARTRALDSDFSPRGESLPGIAVICRRLDGIPLAIEFAAARGAALGPPQVASRLDDRFGLLTGGRRTALPRHQTLRATLDWSYELLPEPQRRLLRRLAIFAAGFTREAATAVMRDTGNGASAVMEGIANLVAKSLMTLDGTAPPVGGGCSRRYGRTRSRNSLKALKPNTPRDAMRSSFGTSSRQQRSARSYRSRSTR